MNVETIQNLRKSDRSVGRHPVPMDPDSDGLGANKPSGLRGDLVAADANSDGCARLLKPESADHNSVCVVRAIPATGRGASEGFDLSLSTLSDRLSGHLYRVAEVLGVVCMGQSQSMRFREAPAGSDLAVPALVKGKTHTARSSIYVRAYAAIDDLVPPTALCR